MAFLHIKNMVCDRCIRAVETILQKTGIAFLNISLGKVEVETFPGRKEMDLLSHLLAEEGFEFILDANDKLVNRIKMLVIEEVFGVAKRKKENENYSDFLRAELGMDYSRISNLFSKTEGKTIEKYIIYQKVERAKELLEYGELSLSEIAWELGYSSVQHISKQFKQITGITPSQFKKGGSEGRKMLNDI